MRILRLWWIAIVVFTAEPALTETVKIPIGTQTPESQQIVKPSTGMNKRQVEIEFGQAQRTHPAKGKPPISSWEYEDFIVYFENDHVIHSVVKPRLHDNTNIVIQKEEVMSEEDLKLNQ